MLSGCCKNHHEEAVKRLALESEMFGLKIIQLFLPSPFNKSKLIREIRAAYDNSAFNLNENATSTLGLIASIGLIILLVLFVVQFIKRDKTFEYIDYLSLTAVFMMLVCTAGGFGTMFNYIITPQLRCYNRGGL